MSPDDQRRTSRLQVIVTDDRGRRLSRPGLTRWLRRVAPVRARGEVTLALVGDRAMRTLNRRYAGHDDVTDVLSFPAGEDRPSQRHRPRSADRLPPYLGDIVIATGLASVQAREAGHGLKTELRILALHGLLHLLGYDHSADRGTMARLEGRLRRKGGLGSGLIERAGRAGGGRTPKAASRQSSRRGVR